MAPPTDQGIITMTAAPVAKTSAGASEHWCFGGFAIGMMALMVLVEAWPQVEALLAIPAQWSTTVRAFAVIIAVALAIQSTVCFMRRQR